MDAERFDALVRVFGNVISRRRVGALLAGLGMAVLPDLTGEARRGNRKQRKDGRATRRQRGKRTGPQAGRRRARAEAAPPRCFPGSPCIPGPGKNLSQCNFGGSSALKGKNVKGANLGGANLAGADASGANLAGVNLTNVCLVGANLRGATINSSTNTGGAVFCRTTMPDGSTNNAGCGKDTVCCSTCGGRNQPCCAGDACDGDLFCDGRGICVPCGGANVPCCPGDVCDGRLYCALQTDGTSICEPCGLANVPCCDDDTCDSPDLICRTTIGVCVECGDRDELCCAGNTCNGTLRCTRFGCGVCGGQGQQCCVGAECDGALVCGAEQCVTSCGALGERCCGSGDARDLTCDSAGLICGGFESGFTCVACGGRGERCCAGNICGSGLVCDSSSGAAVCRAGGT